MDFHSELEIEFAWFWTFVAWCDGDDAWAEAPQAVVTAVQAATAAHPALRVLAVTHNHLSRRSGGSDVNPRESGAGCARTHTVPDPKRCGHQHVAGYAFLRAERFRVPRPGEEEA